jgi:hypothetical protein
MSREIAEKYTKLVKAYKGTSRKDLHEVMSNLRALDFFIKEHPDFLNALTEETDLIMMDGVLTSTVPVQHNVLRTWGEFYNNPDEDTKVRW